MYRTTFHDAARLAATAMAALLLVTCSRPRPTPANTDPLNVPLVTQQGIEVRFHDRIRGEVVLVNFMFTKCNGACPRTTGNLRRVQDALGDHLGRDVFIYSVSLDPTVDTPAVLARYAENLGAKPGWTFLTGRQEDIDRLRRRLGLYDRDPAVDGDKTQHAGLIVYGNDATGTWAAVSGLAEPSVITASVLRMLRPVEAAGTIDSVWKP